MFFFFFFFSSFSFSLLFICHFIFICFFNEAFGFFFLVVWQRNNPWARLLILTVEPVEPVEPSPMMSNHPPCPCSRPAPPGKCSERTTPPSSKIQPLVWAKARWGRDKHRYTYLRILGTLYNTYLSSYVSAVPITKRRIDTYRVLICQSAPPFPPLQPSHPRHLSTSPRHPTSILLARANHYYIYAAPLIFNSANRDPSTYRCATCIQASTSPCRIPHPASTVVECLLFLIPSHLSVNLSILFINLLLFTSSL